MVYFSIWLILTLVNYQTINSVPQIGKWERYVFTFKNDKYSCNPFELEINATFTHQKSNTILIVPGYYAGDNTWKIGFMPTLTGKWIFETSSDDKALDKNRGELLCHESGKTGMLKADSISKKKWKYTDGDYVIPIALRIEFFSEPETMIEFRKATEFMSKNNLQLMETRLTEETGQFGGRHDFIFRGNWKDHKFDLFIWDRMEKRMNILAEKGLGAHIMFYSDDKGKPGWKGKSDTEKLVIRYAVARLSGYPNVWFNTGIDVKEYRTKENINWFGYYLKKLDPYDHPISSRYDDEGASGNHIMNDQTFVSRGDTKAKIKKMIGYYENFNKPVSMDDAWGENMSSHPEKEFSPEDIRRAFWKCVMAGGLGGLIRGSDGYYHIENLEENLKSEQWLNLINPMINKLFGNEFANVEPDSSLISNGYCIANKIRSKLLFYTIGTNDKFDIRDGKFLTIKLNSFTKIYKGKWINPRNGKEIEINKSFGRKNKIIEPPSIDDWLLFLTSENI